MRVFGLVFLVLALAGPVWAEARVTVLMDAMRFRELTQIIRTEGLQDAEALNADLLNGQGGLLWQNQVDALYNPVWMQDLLHAALRDGLDEDALDQSIAFFDTHQGQTITQLEVAARQAILDEAIQRSSVETYQELEGTADPHMALVTEFVEVNDLVELNVAVTMSSSFQFYRGLADGRFLDKTEGDILSDVWASEDKLRADARDWIFGYLLMAYQPLEMQDLRAYLTFSQSKAGAALNAALFAAYEDIFQEVAYGLGRAVALNATGNEL